MMEVPNTFYNKDEYVETVNKYALVLEFPFP